MEQYSKYLILPLFVASIFFISWYPSQNDFPSILAGFTVAFLCYFLIISRILVFDNSFYTLLFLGIIARAVLILIFPNLSDDIYRFFWDGNMIYNGLNPYNQIPEAYLDYANDESLLAIEQMNSRSYYTIYPPVAQLIFYLGALSKTVSGFSIILKTIFILFDLLAVFFLTRLCSYFELPKENVFFYFLNPLVIVEGVGNLHFEAIMLSLFAGALYFLSKFRIWSFVVFFVLAVATKLIPLLFGPILFLKHLKLKDAIRTVALGFLITLIISLPVHSGFQSGNFAESLDLYFRKFEFNASLYYLMRKIGFWFTGYNTIQTIGPVLGVISFMSILYLSFRPKNIDLKTIVHACIAIMTIYLITATTVHPWYLMTLIMLAVFNPYKFIFAWSYLVVLSYFTYSNTEFNENIYLLILQYGVVFTLIAHAIWKPANSVLNN